MGVVFLRASRTPPEAAWHAVAAAVHTLLGVANLLFWHSFVVGHVLWVGYLSTTAHFWFVLVHTVALATRRRSKSVSSRPTQQPAKSDRPKASRGSNPSEGYKCGVVAFGGCAGIVWFSSVSSSPDVVMRCSYSGCGPSVPCRTCSWTSGSAIRVTCPTGSGP